MLRGITAVLFLLALLPAALSETLVFSSDLHLTAERSEHAAALEGLRELEGDALILLGDSTNNAHEEEHADVLAFLASAGRPAYILPGNHDITLDPMAFAARYRDYGWRDAFSQDAASASYAVYTAGGTCLLMLDTNDEPGYVAPLGGISGETCAWVTQVLSILPAGTPVVACGHHPILPAERESRTPGAVRLAEALRQGGVQLYLCGHDHGFAAVESDGLQQITVGRPQNYPGWAGILEVDAAGYRWRVAPLYDAATRAAMADRSAEMFHGMARGVLKGTPCEDDAEAIEWFVEATTLSATSQLTPEVCVRLLDAPAAHKWRTIETKTVVKQWIFGILESCPQDVRAISISRDQ